MKFIKKFFKNLVPKNSNDSKIVVKVETAGVTSEKKVKPLESFLKEGGFDLDDKGEPKVESEPKKVEPTVKKKPGRPKGSSKKTPSKSTPSKKTPAKKK